MAAAWLASTCYCVSYTRPALDLEPDDVRTFALSGGIIHYATYHPIRTPTSPGPTLGWHVRRSCYEFDWVPPLTDLAETQAHVRIPMWVVLLIIAAPTAALWLVSWWRRPAQLPRSLPRIGGAPMKWLRRSVYGAVLLTWLAILGLWIHSYWFIALYGVLSRKGFPVHAIMSSRGSIMIYYYYPHLSPDTRYDFMCARLSSLPANAPSKFRGELAFFYGKSFLDPTRQIAIMFPHWIPAAALLPFVAIPPILWWRRRRIRPGTCPNCGYDLRATPERCPECGTERIPASASSASSAVQWPPT
jgi:hypothetical protein